jgi:hypothetical protein
MAALVVLTAGCSGALPSPAPPAAVPPTAVHEQRPRPPEAIIDPVTGTPQLVPVVIVHGRFSTGVYSVTTGTVSLEVATIGGPYTLAIEALVDPTALPANAMKKVDFTAPAPGTYLMALTGASEARVVLEVRPDHGPPANTAPMPPVHLVPVFITGGRFGAERYDARPGSILLRVTATGGPYTIRIEPLLPGGVAAANARTDIGFTAPDEGQYRMQIEGVPGDQATLIITRQVDSPASPSGG